MSRVVCYTSEDGQVATCIHDEVKCHLCDIIIPDNARSSICDRGNDIPSEYRRGYEEGAKAERELVLDELTSNFRVTDPTGRETEYEIGFRQGMTHATCVVKTFRSKEIK